MQLEMIKRANFLSIIFVLFGIMSSCLAQTKIALTIDDVPNTKKYKKDSLKLHLLNYLQNAQIPAAIFINEGLLYKHNDFDTNHGLLEEWVKEDLVTVGNHSFSHLRYSDAGISTFKNDIEKGEQITQGLTDKYNKSFEYFRLPFNDLGKDKDQHLELTRYLEAKGYIVSPFTIESSDWMFNYIYTQFLQQGNIDEANRIGKLYVEKTLAYFRFFEKLSLSHFDRKINQIYLCHDNAINASFLKDIVAGLQSQGCKFVTLKEVLQDPVYKKATNYYLKWGVSWFYRWIDNQDERISIMRKEPDLSEVNNLYKEMSK